MWYPKGKKAYKLWCLEPKILKCIISEDVIFNEIEMTYKSKVSECKPKSWHESKNENIEVEVGIMCDFLHNDALDDHVEEDSNNENEDREDYSSYNIASGRTRITIRGLKGIEIHNLSHSP